MRRLAWPTRTSALAAFAGTALLLGGCGDGSDTAESGAVAGANAVENAASSTSAEPVIDGEIYAEVNGERRIWYVTHIEREGDWQSGSFWRPAMKQNATVSIFGLAEKSARPTGKGDIQLSFVVADVGGTSKVSGEVFNLFADGPSKTWASDTGGSAKLFLNRVVREGEYLDLGGGFSGEVVLPDLGNAATETDRARTFTIKDGSFAVRLREFQRPD